VQHSFPGIEPYRDNFPSAPWGPVVDRARAMLEQNVVNGELVVPAEHYFAMGDNRDNSLDSRYWGFVPRQNIIGRPLLIYWSVDRDAAVTAGVADDRLSKLADIVYYVAHLPRWRRAMHVVQ